MAKRKLESETQWVWDDEVDAEAPPGVLLTITQYVREVGGDFATMKTRIDKTDVSPVMRRGMLKYYRLRDLVTISHLTTNDGAFNPDGLDPFRAKAYYQSQTEKLRAMEKAGTLVAASDVERQCSNTFKLLARFLETLPDILERDVGMNKMQLTLVESKIDALRTELHAEVTADESERLAAA